MIPFIYAETKFYKNQKACYICIKGLNTGNQNKKHHKVRDKCHYSGNYRGAALNISNLRQKTPKEIHVISNNGSRYGSIIL